MAEQNITKIFTANPNDIYKNFMKAVKYNLHKCDIVLGEGMFGSVSRPNYSAYAAVDVKDKQLVLATAIKKLKLSNEMQFQETLVTKDQITAYINTYVPENMQSFLHSQKFPKQIHAFCSDNRDPHGEYILLTFLSKLWYREITPHVPFLISPMSCSSSNQLDAFLLEANGLRDEVLTFYKTQSLYLQNQATHNKSYCETLYKLLEYIINMGDYETCVLPNKKTVHIPTFIDHMAISYLFTYQQLINKIGLVLQDQHLSNVFMYWLTATSYMGSQSIADLKHIVYEIDDSIRLLINVPGVLLKIGDIGASILKPREDVVVVGELFGSTDAVIKALYADKMPYYMQFIFNISACVPFNILMQTCLFPIYKDPPFNTLAVTSGITCEYPSCSEVLKKYFKKYETKKNVKDALYLKL